jgi:CheY-like chemotaxis protein
VFVSIQKICPSFTTRGCLYWSSILMVKHPAQSAESKGRVLVVDDSPLTLEVVRHLLEREGFEVLAADSPGSAAVALEWGPTIVVLDVNLPGISGVELCRRLKRNGEVTVILFSELALRDLAELAARCGADAYVSKQSGLRQLPERLVDLCQARVDHEPERLRVLLIDDSELALHYERSLLELAGFEVRCVSGLLEFVRELSAWEPNMILTDVDMPEIKGDQLCSTLKSHMSTRQIPIILFSMLDENELESLARRAGADAYLSKRTGYEQLGPRLRNLSQDILW